MPSAQSDRYETVVEQLRALVADWRDQAKRLRNEVPNLRDGTDKRFAAACDADQAADELSALLAAAEGVERDAARYRFLRDPIINAWEPQPAAWIEFRGNEYIESDWLTGELADAAIDKAMRLVRDGDSGEGE